LGISDNFHHVIQIFEVINSGKADLLLNDAVVKFLTTVVTFMPVSARENMQPSNKWLTPVSGF
jgi:hypothetical protein